MQEPEPTIIAGVTPSETDRTQVVSSPGATLMGASVTCPVCRSRNMEIEIYCSECGFLLASEPQEQAAPKEAPVTLRNTRTGQMYPLEPGEYSVGRDSADILLADPSVSRQHAKITVGPGEFAVTDLGSTNGTQIDAARIESGESGRASDSSEIRFGNVVLTVSISEVEAGEDTAEEDTVQEVDPVDQLDSANGVDEEGVDLIDAVDEVDAPAYLKDAESGKIYPIGPDGAAIGRREGNDIVLDNPYVSSSHASLSVSDGEFTLIDNGSTNGTSVNDDKLQQGVGVQLSEGDRVTFGPLVLIFHKGAQS